MDKHHQGDPFEIFFHEHRQVLDRLRELETAVTSIVENGFSAQAFSRIADVIRFFNTDFRKHDQREEKMLFPMIETYAKGSTAPFRAEHRQLWSAFDRLQKSVMDVETSKVHGSTIRELVDASRLIIDLLRTHVSRENDELFPLAKKVLPAETYPQFRKI